MLCGGGGGGGGSCTISCNHSLNNSAALRQFEQQAAVDSLAATDVAAGRGCSWICSGAPRSV